MSRRPDDLGRHEIKITRVKIYPYEDEDSSLLAFASIELNDIFVISGIKVVKGKKGTFVTMPSSKGKDGNYYDVCYPLSSDAREKISEEVLKEYKK